MCRTIHKIALITNLTQSLGGVEFKVDSVNNKGQYSIDGGSTWQNFSSGGIDRIVLPAIPSGTSYYWYFSGTYFVVRDAKLYSSGGEEFDIRVAANGNGSMMQFFDSPFVDIYFKTTTVTTITAVEDIYVNGTLLPSGQSIDVNTNALTEIQIA